MKLRYTSPALADLNSILDYISDASPRGAERVKRRIQGVIELLLDHPRMGAPTEDPTIRRLSTPPYPFLIFYEAVRHAARDPSTMPDSE